MNWVLIIMFISGPYNANVSVTTIPGMVDRRSCIVAGKAQFGDYTYVTTRVFCISNDGQTPIRVTPFTQEGP